MANKKFQVNDTKQALLRNLTQLKAMDAITEWRKKKWGWFTGLSGALIFLSFFLIGIFSANLSGDNSYLIILLVFFGAFLIGLVNYIRNKRKDIENRKLDSVIKLLQCVGEDIPPSAICELTVDFSDYRKGGVLISKEKKLFGPKQFVYNHKWLTFAGKLFDGNKFELEVEQDVKRKEVPKRKYTKVKENITETASLKLRFNPEFYPAPAKVAENINKGQSPYGMDVKGVLGTDKSLKVTMSTAPAKFLTGRAGWSGDEKILIDGDKLLGLFMLTYEALKKSKRAA